jgi:branched-chain amino acid aminotransferase
MTMRTITEDHIAQADVHGGDSAAQKQRIAFFRGEFVPADQALVSVFDHSFLYGDGVFESITYRHGQLFELEAHVDRLIDSCTVLQIELPLNAEELRLASIETVNRNEARSGDLRIVVSRGEGYPMFDPRRARDTLVVISIQERPVVSYPKEQGLRLVVPSTRRIPPACLDPRVKSNNYLNHVTAKLQAIAAGADEALMLDINDDVAELPGANIFALKRGELATPPPTHILAGITRTVLMRLARSGVSPLVNEVNERRMTLYDIYTADEVILSGTGLGIAFVAEVDGRVIGEGRCGPAALALGRAYDQLLEDLADQSSPTIGASR